VWSFALTEGPQPGFSHVGLRVSSDDELRRIRAVHRELELPTEDAAAGSEPHQGPALRVRPHDDHSIEYYHEFDEISLGVAPDVRLPMRNTHEAGSNGPTRIDHVNLRVTDVPSALGYWTQSIGLTPSEYWLHPDGTIRVAWLRGTAGKTHDVAIGSAAKAGVHHVAYLVADVNGLVAAADRLGDLGLESSLEYGPSRHGVTNALCMYIRDPDGHRIELYTGDYSRDLDRPPISWTAEEYARHGHSWWGQQVPESFAEISPVVEGSRARDLASSGGT
jgi:catechol 2,3-dioxygenase